MPARANYNIPYRPWKIWRGI